MAILDKFDYIEIESALTDSLTGTVSPHYKTSHLDWYRMMP